MPCQRSNFFPKTPVCMSMMGMSSMKIRKSLNSIGCLFAKQRIAGGRAIAERSEANAPPKGENCFLKMRKYEDTIPARLQIITEVVRRAVSLEAMGGKISESLAIRMLEAQIMPIVPKRYFPKERIVSGRLRFKGLLLCLK